MLFAEHTHVRGVEILPEARARGEQVIAEVLAQIPPEPLLKRDAEAHLAPRHNLRRQQVRKRPAQEPLRLTPPKPEPLRQAERELDEGGIQER